MKVAPQGEERSLAVGRRPRGAGGAAVSRVEPRGAGWAGYNRRGRARAGVWCVCLTAAPTPQYQSRGLVKAPGKSSFTMFVDLGIYQPGGSGDTIPITGETRDLEMGTGGPLMTGLHKVVTASPVA